MNLRQSISHPELLVSDNGDFYLEGRRLPINMRHELTIKGPALVYRYRTKIKQLSAQRLVFEAHVIKRKIKITDHIDPIDGDLNNIKADNLKKGSKYIRGVRVKQVKSSREPYSCWINGHDEVYI